MQSVAGLYPVPYQLLHLHSGTLGCKALEAIALHNQATVRNRLLCLSILKSMSILNSNVLLNIIHLILKCLQTPASVASLLTCFCAR